MHRAGLESANKDDEGQRAQGIHLIRTKQGVYRSEILLQCRKLEPEHCSPLATVKVGNIEWKIFSINLNLLKGYKHPLVW